MFFLLSVRMLRCFLYKLYTTISENLCRYQTAGELRTIHLSLLRQLMKLLQTNYLQNYVHPYSTNSLLMKALIFSDGFTHRPWPRAPRFWGPRATFSYDSSILTKSFRNCAWGTTLKRAEMQIVSLDSYQYSNNTTILCIWAWERCRPSL